MAESEEDTKKAAEHLLIQKHRKVVVEEQCKQFSSRVRKHIATHITIIQVRGVARDCKIYNCGVAAIWQ